MDIRDQLGRTITLAQPARRIVSLVPSQTELLYDLGLDDEVAGITKFCIHPEQWFRSKLRVGGTKDFKTDIIRAASPDLILANKEENDQELLKNLAEDLNVWISDIVTLEDALQMIRSVGQLTGTASRADQISDEISSAFAALNKPLKGRVLYLIWNDPVMVAGRETFIDEMLRYCGYENACTEYRYPVLDDDKIRKIDPDVLLLSSEPFPFRQQHAERFRKLLPSAAIKFVDGEMFSWYGSRLRSAPAYFRSLA